jgi:hypothetical protein
MAAGTSSRSFAIAREIYLRAETLAYRDSHAARATVGEGRVGEGRVGDRPLGFLGRRLF